MATLAEFATASESLVRVIEREVNLGQKDPSQIAQRILSEYGEAWVFDQIQGIEIVRRRAAQYLNSQRRLHEEVRFVSTGSIVPSDKERLVSKWVEGKGWVREADLTVEDCLAIAAHYRRLEAENAAKADLWESRAALMREQGASCLGELT